MIQVLNPSKGKRFFLLPKHPDWLWVPPSVLFNGYWVPFLSGAEVKNKWNCRCTSAPWGAWHEQRQLYLFYIMPVIYLEVLMNYLEDLK